ncbi:hypothetical protein L2E82_46184 [Cichorium intybus]|uniref:Uncharacterized protein n=1 Tax=Cichorium intybus TaxID=13427 RepID=A0ACB8YTD7_CICIN|nr:hypothetical protein L2E82_46184 [Cichorium intybus]
MSTKHLKPTKPPVIPSPPPSRSSSLSAHLAMVELKQRILTSLSRLSDRDTHQIAVEDLETIIQTVAPDSIPMLLNSLYDATNDTTTNKPPVKKEAIRLLSFLCATHTESAASHLTKIITHIVKRLKDPDSGVKDSCRESIGHLSFLYLKGERGDNNIGSVVSLFVKPLFDAMNEQNKAVQAGAALCMAKMVEMASDPPVLGFQKLCSRICKFLNSPNFLANAALLPVVSRLSQVGAISPQALEPLLQSINDCLNSSDWSTRKAAADTLIVLALHSSNLIKEKPTSTISTLEACRFDKIKPVRDSITEALQLWNRIAESCEDQKTSGHGEDSEQEKLSRKDLSKLDAKRLETPAKNGETKSQNVSEKTTGTRKKGPPLSDKELNPEFFQRLETRVSGEVEVIVPRRFLKSSNTQNEEDPDINVNNPGSKSKETYQPDEPVNSQIQAGDPSPRRREFENKGNLLGIQRQLLQLERQQAYIMNMLQDFKGGSHDGMVTLENRVWGLERVVQDMARNFSSVSMYSQRGSNYMMGKYNGFSEYSNMGSSNRGMGRGSSWDYKHGQIGLRRAMDSRLPKGVGPSARSVWQASKDEATLDAIRVAAPEMKADDSVLTAWRNAMDGVGEGDMDMAFSEVLSTGDDLLLVKLMDRTGPVVDQLSSDVASEVLHAVAQFFLEPNLFDICLSWIQQLLDMIVDNGKDVLGIPEEVKREILVNLNKASSSIDPPEDWEGLWPDQLLLQLASAWDINLQQLHK